MSPWSLDYEEFAAMCEQLLGTSTAAPPAPRTSLGRANRGFRGRWFRYAAGSGALAASARRGLRRGLGFPRT